MLGSNVQRSSVLGSNVQRPSVRGSNVQRPSVLGSNVPDSNCPRFILSKMFIVQVLKVQGQNVPNVQRPRLKCPKFKRPRLKRPRFICPIVRGLNDQRFIWPRAKRPNTKRPRLKCTLDQFSKNKRPGFECTLRLVFVYFFITVYCIIKEGQNIYYNYILYTINCVQYVRVCVVHVLKTASKKVLCVNF